MLSFPTGTLPDLIKDKENGYLTQDKNELALVQGIRWLTTDKKRLQQLGIEAHKDYLEFYTLEKMTFETLLFYDLCRR